MNSSIRAKDLKDNQSLSNEEALYIAVEAILNGDFEKLRFSKNVVPSEIKENIINSQRFEEIKASITYEKNILNSFLSDNEPVNDLSKLTEIQTKTIEALYNNTEKNTPSPYAKFAVAASILVVVLISVLGSSFFINSKNNDNFATKSKLQDRPAFQKSETLYEQVPQDKDVQSGSNSVSRDSNETETAKPTSEEEITIKPPDTTESTMDNNADKYNQAQSNTPVISSTSFIERNIIIIATGALFLFVLLLIILFKVLVKYRKDQ